MKKRIIALILVIAMSVLALASCGEYDYSDVDFEECTTVNLTDLQKALLSIIIEDGYAVQTAVQPPATTKWEAGKF